MSQVRVSKGSNGPVIKIIVSSSAETITFKIRGLDPNNMTIDADAQLGPVSIITCNTSMAEKVIVTSSSVSPSVSSIGVTDPADPISEIEVPPNNKSINVNV